jgi:uncharacterized protein
MSHFLHDLHAEFPADSEILHGLKLTDKHFPKLADDYHALNKDIQRIENGMEASSDDRLEDYKKRRLVMLDEVSAMIDRAKTA